MDTEIEKAKSFYENKMYDKSLEILLKLEGNLNDDIFSRVKIYKEIFKNYKEQGDLKSALEYYKKFSEGEFQILNSENKTKTDKLASTLKIRSSQKENELLYEKNNELKKANEALNKLREKKNELLTIISEELKLPIVTIEGISFNYYRTLNENREVDIANVKSELETIESLSNQILQNVNSILQKSKENNEV